ncbi:hypothetical protein B0H13DRAFT_1919585 [Mycena leptocephala]|nr:hypothetical protein B0H13DRAFT_1919585 [Mycena leptocephala]
MSTPPPISPASGSDPEPIHYVSSIDPDFMGLGHLDRQRLSILTSANAELWELISRLRRKHAGIADQYTKIAGRLSRFQGSLHSAKPEDVEENSRKRPRLSPQLRQGSDNQSSWVSTSYATFVVRLPTALHHAGKKEIPVDTVSPFNGSATSQTHPATASPSASAPRQTRPATASPSASAPRPAPPPATSVADGGKRWKIQSDRRSRWHESRSARRPQQIVFRFVLHAVSILLDDVPPRLCEQADQIPEFVVVCKEEHAWM